MRLWGDIFCSPLKRKRNVSHCREAGNVATFPATAMIEEGLEGSESSVAYILLFLPKHFTSVQAGVAWEFRRYLSLELYHF